MEGGTSVSESVKQYPELTEREKAVFRAIMEQYIRQAEPVGSRTIAKSFGLSPATIRNIMADLEDYGLITQPHISAGRVPSDEGYRYFVDHMIKAGDTQTVLPEHRRRIREALNVKKEIERIMKDVSDLLSELTRFAGVVVTPKVVNMAFKRIQFIRLSDKRILVVFVAQSGLVQNKIIFTDEDYDQDELDRISRLLNDRFENRTLSQIRSELVKMVEAERKQYDRLLNSAARLGKMALNKELFEKEKVFIEGTVNILDLPEFKDLGKLRELFKTFTERSAVIRLLDRCLDTNGVSIAIGSETEIPDLEDMSVVTSKYSMGDGLAGGLGVIGPKRMPYQQVAALVSYMATFLSMFLENWDTPDVNSQNDKIGDES